MSEDGDKKEKRRYQRGFWRNQELTRLATWDWEKFPATWMCHEVFEALNAIEGPNERKKRTTVIRMAEALACGLPVREVFKMPGVCNQATWYGHHITGQGPWRDRPDVQHALEVCKRRAHYFYDLEQADRMELRLRQLAMTSDELVDLTQLATDVLGDLMLNADSERIRLEAAAEVLNRADDVTAAKGQTKADLTLRMGVGPTMADIRKRSRMRLDKEDEEGEGNTAPQRLRSPAPLLAAPESLDVFAMQRESVDVDADDAGA